MVAPNPWWRYGMGIFSALLALCEGNPPITGGFPSQSASDAEIWCFLSCTYEQTIEQTQGRRWFQTPWPSLACHCDFFFAKYELVLRENLWSNAILFLHICEKVLSCAKLWPDWTMLMKTRATITVNCYKNSNGACALTTISIILGSQSEVIVTHLKIGYSLITFWETGPCTYHVFILRLFIFFIFRCPGRILNRIMKKKGSRTPIYTCVYNLRQQYNL